VDLCPLFLSERRTIEADVVQEEPREEITVLLLYNNNPSNSYSVLHTSLSHTVASVFLVIGNMPLKAVIAIKRVQHSIMLEQQMHWRKLFRAMAKTQQEARPCLIKIRIFVLQTGKSCFYIYWIYNMLLLSIGILAELFLFIYLILLFIWCRILFCIQTMFVLRLMFKSVTQMLICFHMHRPIRVW